ncbi:nucleolar and spindle-associated protein 1 [Pholidichthys leucotaenia]
MDLDSMKYAELQSLAKELGLKANMKADKLLKSIKQRYQQEKCRKEKKFQGRGHRDVRQYEHAAQGNAQADQDASCNEVISSPTVFVNTRRGKRKSVQRKMSDSAADADSMPPNAAEDETEIKCSTSCNAKGAKKRKLSHMNETEAKPPKEPQSNDNEEQQLQPAVPVDGDTMSKIGKIPRYQRLLQQRNKPLLKPVTPNFKKIHEAQFGKMESIDSYVQRKAKKTHKNSVKEQKPLDKTPQQVDNKAKVKEIPSRASMFSPVSVNGKPAEEKPVPNKPAGKQDVPFRPSILSTRRINVRFSEATHDNEYKRSLVKTPARMSLCMTSTTPKKQTTDGRRLSSVKVSTFSVTKTPVPFMFTGNTSTIVTPGTQKKTTFDLKASLSRPLTYKPHKGKLKPFGESIENTAAEMSFISNTHQQNYKQHKVQSRDDRRAKQIHDRKQKKEGILGARRGLVMM